MRTMLRAQAAESRNDFIHKIAHLPQRAERTNKVDHAHSAGCAVNQTETLNMRLWNAKNSSKCLRTEHPDRRRQAEDKHL